MKSNVSVQRRNNTSDEEDPLRENDIFISLNNETLGFF